jgi:hypothetical protein
MSEDLLLNPRVRFRAVGDEGVVVQIENSEVIVVNEVGLRILGLLREGVVAVPEIADKLHQEYQAPVEQLQSDVVHYAAQLRRHNILQDETV